MQSTPLLVCAGEASGDAMAAAVLDRLGTPFFGMGGPALQRAGLDTTIDARTLDVMGVGAALGRIGDIARAAILLVSEARRRRPRAALLVGYSEFNARLGKVLRRFGTRVLWYAPPQVWAWRARRVRTLTASCDAMAVILPFEAELWRRAGMDATFVGHPVLENGARAAAGSRTAPRVLLLPGSRRQEVRRHWPVMLEAAGRLASVAPAGVVLAPSLSANEREWITKTAASHGVRRHEDSVASALDQYDVAIAASGTVTLECAAAGVPPVIIYKTDPLTYAMARRLIRVTSVGLPNLVAGERIFPELLQHDAEPAPVSDAVLSILDDGERYRRSCNAIRDKLRSGASPPSLLVARMLEKWI